MKDENKTQVQLIDELAELRRRVAELEEAEKRQQILSTVRDAVWKIPGSRDIEKVLTPMVGSLRDLAVPFHTCAINVVDVSTDPPSVSFCNLNQEGKWIQTKGEQGSEAIACVLRFWQDQTVVYRPDLEEEDLYGEANYIDKILEHHIRSVIDVPFSHGTLAVNSTEAPTVEHRLSEKTEAYRAWFWFSMMSPNASRWNRNSFAWNVYVPWESCQPV